MQNFLLKNADPACFEKVMGHLVWITVLWILAIGALAAGELTEAEDRGFEYHESRSCSQQVSSMCKKVCKRGTPCQLRAAVLLPQSEPFDVTLPLVQAALSAALKHGVLPANYSMVLDPSNDRCESYAGAVSVAAFAAECAHVFFGPFCEYALAAVGRLVKFYGTPLVTTGGLSTDFQANKTTCSNEYHMLVRVGTVSFRDMSQFLILLMEQYNWKKVMLVYEKNGYSHISGEHTCHLFMQSFVDDLKKKKYLYSSYDMEKNPEVPIKEHLRREMQLIYSNAFIGPVCDYVLAPIARYSGVWNLPVLTAGGLADAFLSKDTFPTLTRVMGSFSLVGEALRLILNEFGWGVAGFLYHNHAEKTNKGNSNCHFTLSAVYRALNKTPTYRSFDEERATYEEYRSLLQLVSKTTRIVVVCANPKTVRDILLAAEELDMVESGEYVFFNIELFDSMSQDNMKPWYNETDTAERNERARKAYEALLTVTAFTPNNSQYNNFSKEVKEMASSQFNYTSNSSVSTFVTAFYDAVVLYALALNKTLRAGGTERDGVNITQNMWNVTFKGITGDVTIDKNGDRIADYSLLDMNPETSQFHTVAIYIGANRTLQKVNGTKIHWAGNRKGPPPDTPLCGFDGSLCPDNSLPDYAILSIVLSSLVIIVTITSGFLYRHYKLEAAIESQNWRVHWSDVVVVPSERVGGSIYSQVKYDSHFVSDLTTLSSEDNSLTGDFNRQMFAQVAYYKGAQVALKAIRKSELTRPLLLELKTMKDMHHDHLVRFLGACFDSPNCYLLTEYCPKGSLQDILENEKFELDWMFRYSLMQDLIKGMCYLHNSDVRSHGNLKSSNCVVDSRFVLKITDFGLNSLRTVRLDIESSFAYWHRFLWTAPELLRMQNPPPQGSQKGDVFSFGIIVHEIVRRKGVFYLGDDHLSPKEIVENVKNGQNFRPLVDEQEDEAAVTQLMRRCWAEEPADRPDFNALKSAIRKLNRNDSGNILDNLLSRMEQYANNLEAQVEERTSLYLEQKRKCEELLYQLLPKSVANQLILGQSVIAETYDNVTIYFSDIVGFTPLCAKSTPLQVVDLLNDLYTCFDSVIENYDVYKVETIGDAYMVVSGLPVRNGNLHAQAIARVALALLQQVRGFKIRHKPDQQLMLRIGIHTGNCVAGVVGHKMPRYCLFGDTVNTANRMESNGEPLKIHVSATTKAVLDTFGTFELELRGEVELKGKGKMTTYWLLGEKEQPAAASSSPAVPSTSKPTMNTSSLSMTHIPLKSTSSVPVTQVSMMETSSLCGSKSNAAMTNSRSNSVMNVQLIDPRNPSTSLTKSTTSNNVNKSPSKLISPGVLESNNVPNLTTPLLYSGLKNPCE